MGVHHPNRCHARLQTSVTGTSAILAGMANTMARLRLAARAIVIDDAGRTLLFRARIPGPAERFIWITPGGGIQEGEDEPSCVRREVFEETGLADFELGPCVWRRDHTFR